MAKKRNNCNSRINGKCYRGAPCAAAIARSLATGSTKVSSETRSLSGLWRKAAEAYLGEDISEILEYVPASLKVVQYVRPKLACAGCDRIVQAQAPSQPIVVAVLQGPGLLAHVLVSKYCDHLPLYRRSRKIYARSGVELDRSTLAEWVGGSSELLAPLVGVLRRHVLSAGKLHADDIPVPVLAPGLGKTKTGRLWTYVRDDRPAGDRTPAAVWFAYSPDRKGQHPQAHLSNFTGTLQADGYAGFDQIYAAGRVPREAACWSARTEEVLRSRDGAQISRCS